MRALLRLRVGLLAETACRADSAGGRRRRRSDYSSRCSTAAARVDATAQAEWKGCADSSPVGDVSFGRARSEAGDPRRVCRGARRSRLARSTDGHVAATRRSSEKTKLFPARRRSSAPQVMLTAARSVPTSGKVSFVRGTRRRTPRPARATPTTRPTSRSRLRPLFCVAGVRCQAQRLPVQSEIDSSAMTGHLDKEVILAGPGHSSDDRRSGATEDHRVGATRSTKRRSPQTSGRGAKYYRPKQVDDLFSERRQERRAGLPGRQRRSGLVRSRGGRHTFVAGASSASIRRVSLPARPSMKAIADKLKCGSREPEACLKQHGVELLNRGSVPKSRSPKGFESTLIREVQAEPLSARFVATLSDVSAARDAHVPVPLPAPPPPPVAPAVVDLATAGADRTEPPPNISIPVALNQWPYNVRLLARILEDSRADMTVKTIMASLIGGLADSLGGPLTNRPYRATNEKNEGVQKQRKEPNNKDDDRNE